MALTLRKLYSKIAKGIMAANGGWKKVLNTSFEFPDGITAEGGNKTVELWDTFTTYTPTPGTIQTNKGNNLLVDLTVGITGTKLVKTGQQKRAMEFNPEAMATAAEQAGDALDGVLQGLVVAAAYAATPGLSPALPTGYIDFVIPSAATNPDIVNSVFYPLARAVNFVEARAGFNSKDIVILMQEVAYSHLEAALNSVWKPGQLTMTSEGVLQWKNRPIYSLQDTTNFGGASKPCAFVLAGRGFALQAPDPELEAPEPDGWHYGSDNAWHWPWMLPYAYGVANASLIAEVVNPAT